MNKLLLFMVIVAACILLGGRALGSFYSTIESFFAYYPTSSFVSTPEEYSLQYEDVFFSSADGVNLHGWLFPIRSKEAPVLLFCHGNAGNISHRLDLIQHLVANQMHVFIFDYRGYGKSEGEPSEAGLYADGVAAYDVLVKRGFRSNNIIIFGRSLGAAVGIEIARQRPVQKMIIEGAFTSTKAMAATIPLIGLFSSLLPAHYNNLEKIEKITIPKLFIHGEQDDIVPFIMGKELFERAPAQKELYAIPGAGHNDTHIVGGKEYFRTIAEFIER